MTYATIQERRHIADVNAGEACAAAQAVRLADLELTPLADALNTALRLAQDVLESRTATEDERRLAERLLNDNGPHDDCYSIRECVGQ